MCNYLVNLWMVEKLAERLVGKLVAFTTGKKVERWEKNLIVRTVVP